MAVCMSTCTAAEDAGTSVSGMIRTSCPTLSANQALAMVNACASGTCAALTSCLDAICPSSGRVAARRAGGAPAHPPVASFRDGSTTLGEFALPPLCNGRAALMSAPIRGSSARNVRQLVPRRGMGVMAR